VAQAVETEVLKYDARLIMHIGDVSYADGRGAVWEAFMSTICRFADAVPYMVAVGNHDYDYKGPFKHDPSGFKPFRPKWGEFKKDSGGECGVALEKRFSMPTKGCAPVATSCFLHSTLFWCCQLACVGPAPGSELPIPTLAESTHPPPWLVAGVMVLTCGVCFPDASPYQTGSFVGLPPATDPPLQAQPPDGVLRHYAGHTGPQTPDASNWTLQAARGRERTFLVLF
jgi:hypothetical protein